MANIQDIFEGRKLTENGDAAYSTTGERYADILFGAPYLSAHIDELAKYGINRNDLIFAMMMRDPRFGLGYRDLGRALMKSANATPDEIVKAGRYDDLIYDYSKEDGKSDKISYIMEQVKAGNELAKKWMPRFGSKNKAIASAIAKAFGLTKQEYGHLVKVDTTEKLLTDKDTDKINFEHVPSLASIKYAKRFASGKDTSERYAEFKNAVKEGSAKLNIATTTPYDIYKNRQNVDADMFFEKLPKISISCMPIVDSSGSMHDSTDSYGKAMAIGHYLSKCSTYCTNKVISFSSNPVFLSLDKDNEYSDHSPYYGKKQDTSKFATNYEKEIARMYTGDCSNTDFGAVMELMKQVDEFPEYLIVLSDMEFDYGSTKSEKEVMEMFRENGISTKIIWWNFNTRAITAPEKTSEGNIFMSGYSPMLLKYLSVGFDNNAFMNTLLNEYKKALKIETM